MNFLGRGRRKNAEMRGGGDVVLALEELEECVSGSGGLESTKSA